MELALDIKPVLGLLKWSWVMKMLQKSPKLQTLIIHEVFMLIFVLLFFFFSGYTFIYYKKNKKINCVSLSGWYSRHLRWWRLLKNMRTQKLLKVTIPLYPMNVWLGISIIFFEDVYMDSSSPFTLWKYECNHERDACTMNAWTSKDYWRTYSKYAYILISSHSINKPQSRSIPIPWLYIHA
jgi:hypothetical protein